MSGPYTYGQIDTDSDVYSVQPNDLNKAPLLVLWLHMSTDWDSFQNFTADDIARIAEKLNTTTKTVMAFFDYAKNNPDTFIQSSNELATCLGKVVYQGPPTQQCLTSASVPSLYAAAAATWENYPLSGYRTALIKEGMRLEAEHKQ